MTIKDCSSVAGSAGDVVGEGGAEGVSSVLPFAACEVTSRVVCQQNDDTTEKYVHMNGASLVFGHLVLSVKPIFRPTTSCLMCDLRGTPMLTTDPLVILPELDLI